MHINYGLLAMKGLPCFISQNIMSGTLAKNGHPLASGGQFLILGKKGQSFSLDP